jgi:hypothetical protein
MRISSEASKEIIRRAKQAERAAYAAPAGSETRQAEAGRMAGFYEVADDETGTGFGEGFTNYHEALSEIEMKKGNGARAAYHAGCVAGYNEAAEIAEQMDRKAV